MDRVFELDYEFKVAWTMDGPIRKIAMKCRFGRERWPKKSFEIPGVESALI
jgi:hypothetical protein